MIKQIKSQNYEAPFRQNHNKNLSSYPKIYFLRARQKKYMNVALIYNIFSVTMYLHIYLWKHVVWVDERKDEYVRVFMNTASIYVFTFECK